MNCFILTYKLKIHKFIIILGQKYIYKNKINNLIKILIIIY
jgi:hypothetical protein